ncbi:uncharacterized protein LOC132740245 [Ruditapes philippinarum]|uniref:uncharacterized protein LOC132740245 n=1 Tax=Ruditapes philippinarum TaxID=129788 RepID=UPI00295A88AC|nr:uncharacterized protein LOC132740245 [Ruditapes philippinarum]
MEKRGYKRKYLENIVEERLKKIRNELFVIDTANDSDDSDAKEDNGEKVEDNFNDQHDVIDSVSELLDYEDSSINESDTDYTACDEDADEGSGETVDNEEAGERISSTLNVVVKKEPTEITVVQRPILGTGEHMYCPIVITDDDIDLNIEEHGLEMLPIQYQPPEVVNLDSSDDEVSVICVEHESEERPKVLKPDQTDEKNCKVDDNLHDNGEQHLNCQKPFSLDAEAVNQHQTIDNENGSQQNQKDYTKNVSVDKMKNTFDNLYKELTIPQALSVLSCASNMQDDDFGLIESETIEKTKKLPPPDYLGIVKRKFDSNKGYNGKNGGKELDAQSKDCPNVLDEVQVSKRPRKSSSSQVDSIKDNNINLSMCYVNQYSDGIETTTLHNAGDIEGKYGCVRNNDDMRRNDTEYALDEDENRPGTPSYILNEDNEGQRKSNSSLTVNDKGHDNTDSAQKEDKLELDKSGYVTKKDGKEQDISECEPNEKGKEQDKAECVSKESDKEHDESECVPKKSDEEHDDSECVPKESDEEHDDSECVPKESDEEHDDSECVPKESDEEHDESECVPKEIKKEQDKAECVSNEIGNESECDSHEDNIVQSKHECALIEGDKEQDNYGCALNDDIEVKKGVYSSEGSKLVSEINNSPQDSHNMSPGTNKDIDHVTNILNKVEGETFKYQDETYLVISSSESDIEEFNNFSDRNKVKKLYKTDKIQVLNGYQLERMEPSVSDQESDTVSQSGSSCTSSDATIDNSVIEIGEDSWSESEAEEEFGSSPRETCMATKDTHIEEDMTLDKSKAFSYDNGGHLKKKRENETLEISKLGKSDNETADVVTNGDKKTQKNIKKSFENVYEQNYNPWKNGKHADNIDDSEDRASTNSDNNDSYPFPENKNVGIFNAGIEAEVTKTKPQNFNNIKKGYNEERTCIKTKESLYRNYSASTKTELRTKDILEVASEDILEVDPFDEIDRAFDSPFKNQNSDSNKDKTTTIRLPSVRNLRPDERIRTRYSSSSRCYSPIRYNKTRSRSLDELDDYIYSRRFDVTESEGHWYEKYKQYDKSINNLYNVNEEQRRPSVWERLNSGRNYTLAVTVQPLESESKKMRTAEDHISPEMTPVKRIVVVKPKGVNESKRYDMENRKLDSGDYDDVQAPTDSLHPIPVVKTVKQKTVQEGFSNRKKSSSPSCIAPLKEVQLSNSNLELPKTLWPGNLNNNTYRQKRIEIQQNKTQTFDWLNFGEVPLRNSDDLSEPTANLAQSRSEIYSFSHDPFETSTDVGEKQKYVSKTDEQPVILTRESHEAIRDSNFDSEDACSSVDGEFTPCKVPLNMKIKLRRFLRCDECGHECRRRKSMVRHFKNTIHKSASLYELNDVNAFEKQENFVVNKIRPFDELVHICPLPGCESVFLCRADCVYHYQRHHMMTDQVYCTASIQKEELCRFRCFYSMLECNVCGKMFADGINLDHHSQNSLHQLFHKYEGTFRIFVCHGCHEYFTSFISAVDHKCMKKNPTYIALRLLHVSKQSKEIWVKVAKKWTKVSCKSDTVS